MIITSSDVVTSHSSLSEGCLPLIFERSMQTSREYPARYPVAPRERMWARACSEYSPPFYESPRLLEQDRTVVAGGWADPAVVSKEEFLRWSNIGYMRSFEGPIKHDELTGRPLNPMGRVGIQGRGLLGKWGPNHAADAIVTRIGPESGRMEVMLVLRRSGEWAFPGGMIDDGETSLVAAVRELEEEATIIMDDTDARLVFRGIGDGPRVTDNAWVETTGYHFHLKENSVLRTQSPVPSDEVLDAKWEVVTPELLTTLYANHGEILSSALKQYRLSGDEVSDIVAAQIDELSHSPLLTTFSQLQGKIGLVGGTFDPFHRGHLAFGEKGTNALNLDAVVFIPTSHNPLKGNGPTRLPRERLEMAMYAVKDSPNHFVSPIEVFTEGDSYTIETVRKIRSELNDPNVSLYLLIGADCLPALPKWKEIHQLVDLCELIPISRAGEPDLITDPRLRSTLASELGEAVVARMAENSITKNVLGGSATELRMEYSSGNTKHPFAIDSVSEYAMAQDIY